MANTSAWFEAVPALLVGLVVVIVPGLVLASAAGVRGALRWAVAPPITFTLAGLSAIMLAAARIPYTAATFALVLVVTAATAWLVQRRVVTRRRAAPVRATDATAARTTPARSASAGFAVAAVALAATTIGFRLAAGIGSPTAVAQLFDNVFHLNAVGLIRATGNGSSLTMGNLTTASSGFYPAGFHDVVALTLGLGIGDVSIAMNAVSLVLAAVVWPMSCLSLASRLFGTRPDVLMVTAVASGLFAAFPYRLFSFGVLYPFMSGLAMLPVLVALVAEFFGGLPTPGRTRTTVIAALAAAAPGIALTHPSVLVAGLVFGLPFAARSLVSTVRAGRAERTWAGSMGWATVYILGTIAVFVVVRPPLDTAPWDTVQDARGAIGSIFLVSPGTGLIAWALIPLAAVGAVRCIREVRRFVVVGSLAALGAVLYFASAALWHPGLRDLIAGVWYRDTERVSALFAIAALPLVVLGGVTLVRLLDRGARRIAPSAPRALTTAGAIVLIVAVMLVVGQRGALAQAQTWLGQSFGQEGVQPLLSDDERQLLEELPELVPPGDTVVGDPRTGASLTYAFSDRRALAPHIFGDRTSEEELLLNRWDEAGTDAQVCDAVRDLGAYWALDFGTDDILGGGRTPIPGIDRASVSPGVVEIARVGDAVLYEATACR